MKELCVVLCAAASAMLVTGCAMCNSPMPNDQSCIEPSHATDLTVTPSPLAFTAPKIAPCVDVFRPNFRAGDKRVTVTGVGKSLDEATSAAISAFIEETNCDFIVAVSRKVSMKTHPSYRFFSTTNYTVTMAGLPIYLDKLEKLPPPPEKKPEAPKPPVQVLTKADIITIVETTINNYFQKNKTQFGLLKLSDINIQMQAKGATADDLAVAFPGPEKKK